MKRPLRKYFLFMIVFLIVLIAVLALFFYKSNHISYNNPDSIAESNTKLIIEQVGKIVFLPKGETPTIATVSDPSLLKNQPFFVDAKKGDQVLIYSNSRKAIIYDPVANKIVNMATLNIGDVNQSNPVEPVSAPKTINSQTPATENKF